MGGRTNRKVFSKDSRLRNHRDRAEGLENKELPGKKDISGGNVPIEKQEELRIRSGIMIIIGKLYINKLLNNHHHQMLLKMERRRRSKSQQRKLIMV
ncbi:hypothetical protein HanXRQr2_Chr05g0202861 [Helianthus annuus]|uniref:Uncharacterized protein n=1 Tax=Helianthus annuus TaxID=4232 RepID=A0A251UMK3_HELAN|nr:hypothetical protein HanXRQr2_Chr05g0202861 [Helianthus annuus]